MLENVSESLLKFVVGNGVPILIQILNAKVIKYSINNTDI